MPKHIIAYTFDQNKQDFTTPEPSLLFKIRLKDFFGRLSPSGTVTCTNAVPSTPSAPTLQSSFETVVGRIDPIADTDIDYYDWDVQEDSGGGYASVAGSPFKKGLTYSYIGTAGYSYKMQVRAVDVFAQTGSYSSFSNIVTLSALDEDDLTANIFDFRPSDSDSNTYATLAGLWDRTVAAGGVAYTVGGGAEKWIEYELPVEVHIFSQMKAWVSGSCNVYCAYKRNPSASWTYLYGPAAGVFQSTATQATAQASPWALSAGKNSARLPTQVTARLWRVYIQGAVTVTVYEWRPWILLAGDEIRGDVLASINYAANAGSMFDLDDGTFKLGGSSTPTLSFDGTDLYIGKVATEHIKVSATAVEIKDGATVYTQLAAGTLTLGDTGGGEYMTIASGGIEGYAGGVKYLDLTSAGVLYLGRVAGGGEYIQVLSTGIIGYANATNYFELTSAGLAYLGDQSNEHIKLSASGLQVYDGATLLATYGASTTFYDTGGADRLVLGTTGITIGDATEGEYTTIDSTNGIRLYGGATLRAQITNAGTFWVGDTTTTERMQWDSTNGLQIFDASNTAKAQFPTSGAAQVSGWYLSANGFADNATEANANIFLDVSNTLIRVGPTTGSYVTIDGANQQIRSSNYVAGMAGAGVTLEPDLLEVGNIACRGIFRTAVFQKDIMSAVGGTVVIRPADVLSTDMSALDASTLTIEGNETFAVGDFLRIKDDTDDEWLEVTNVAAAPTYTVTRDKEAAYAADSNPAWKKGATVTNWGASGAGGLLMTSSMTNAPYLQVFTHAGAPWTTITTMARMGELNGAYGYVASTFGVAIGEYAASKTNVTVDSTSGIRLRTHTVTHIELQPDGDIFIGEDVSDPATTNVAILTAAQWYNGESLSAGDLILGNNAAEDFEVTITDNTETMGTAFQSGELFVANGNAVPDVGSYFEVLGAGDFTGDDLETAKGAAPAANDFFKVTNNGVGTEAVTYLGNAIGDKANLFWDKSAGRINFRGGQTTQAYIDTDGSIIAGGGNVTLSTSGMILATGVEEAKWIKWQSGGSNVSWLYGDKVADDHFLYLKTAVPAANNTSHIRLVSQAPAGGDDVELYLDAFDTGESIYQVMIGGTIKFLIQDSEAAFANGLMVGDETVAAADNDVWLDGDLRSAGGIMVGNRSQDPAYGTIEIDRPTGDPIIIFDTQAADQFTLGVRDQTPVKFKIHSGGALVATSLFELDTSGNLELAGYITNAGLSAFMSQGLVLDQGTYDNEILAFKSPTDVAHGMTTIADTNTFGYMEKSQGAAGGLYIEGLSDASGVAGFALTLSGILGEAADTTKTDGAMGIVHIIARVKDGTGAAQAGANANLVVMGADSTTARFIFDAEGSAHADVEWVAFDDHDDVVLLSDFAVAVDPLKVQMGQFLTYNRNDLERLGIVHFDPLNPTRRGAMVNFTRLSMLTVGGVCQNRTEIDSLEARVTALESH